MKEVPKHRTLSEILKDVDNTTDLPTLKSLWNEIVKNKKQYPLVELKFASEYIADKSLSSNGNYIENQMFYSFLETMF